MTSISCPPKSLYSVPKVWKQCGHEDTIFFTPISSKVARLVSASIWKRYSFPARRAASPLHPSCIPKIPTSSPASFIIDIVSLATFLLRSSKEAAHPAK